tara:strand:+ start:526 stop:1296 length:771 start_codon:yes stop_codon:yes gene_type:complete
MTAARWDIRLSRSLLVVVSLAMGSSTSVAEDIPREQHAWGRFAPGSWTRIRVTLETIGENGQKILRSELVTTRLQKVDQHGVTLQRETVGVGKNDVPIKHKPVVLNWDGTRRDGLRTERLSLGEIKILGRSHTCQTHTVTRAIGDTRITTKSWYSPDTAPFFLKQLVRVRGLKPRHTARDVTRLKATRKIGEKSYPGWEARTVVADSAGRAQMLEFHSHLVPGGLVHARGERHDPDSARIGTTIQVLDGFHAVPAD